MSPKIPDDRLTGATMHYTSGTTGRPKGVRRALADLDPDTVAEITAALIQLFGVPERGDNVHLVTSPNYHTAVTTFAGASLQLGHTLVLQDKWQAAETLQLIERYACTVTHMVPTHFVRLLGLPEDVPDDVLEAFCARLVGQGGSDAGTGTGQATAPRARARRRNSAAQQ